MNSNISPFSSEIVRLSISGQIVRDSLLFFFAKYTPNDTHDQQIITFHQRVQSKVSEKKKKDKRCNGSDIKISLNDIKNMEERQKITDKIVNFYDFFIAELMAKYQEQIDADEKKRISDNMNILKNFQLYLKEVWLLLHRLA